MPGARYVASNPRGGSDHMIFELAAAMTVTAVILEIWLVL